MKYYFKREKRKYFVGVFFLLLIAIFYSIANLAKDYSRDQEREYINPGSPKSPINLNRDWFELGREKASNLRLKDILKRCSYSLLLRVENGVLMEPELIWINPQTVLTPSGVERVVEGYSFNYRDRIYLSADPTSFPLDFGASLKAEGVPNTEGKTRVNFLTFSRGKKSIGREKGVQKWEDGTTNKYPSMLRWQEEGEGEIPYVTYTLLGDCSVRELQKIAEELVVAKR